MARDERIELRARSEQADRWRAAAADAGYSFSEWARAVLDAAAEAPMVQVATVGQEKTRGVRAPKRDARTVGPAGGKRSYAPDFKKGTKR